MFNNSTRAGLIIFLSALSKKTILTKVTIPKLANTSYYQVENKNDDINFFITDYKNQDLSNELKAVFNSVWHEYMGEYIFDERALDNDKFILDKIGRIVLKYAKNNSTEKLLETLDVYNQKANIVNGELYALSFAECFGKACVAEMENLKDSYFMERLYCHMESVVAEEMNEIIERNSWAAGEDEKEIGESAKVKAKLFTYAALNGYVECAICTNRILGNAFCLGVQNENGEIEMLSFHTKKGKSAINDEFADKFYTKYLKTVEEPAENLSLEEKEAKFAERFVERYDPANAARFMIAFVETIIGQVNFGEDQVVATALALNVANYLETKDEFGRSTKMGFVGKEKEELDEIFEENFELARTNSNEAMKKIGQSYIWAKQVLKKSESMKDVIENMLKSLFGSEKPDEENEEDKEEQ